MKFVADLHIHSHFSRATSKDLTFEHLTKWAQLKGVHVVGTGDIAHPGWLQEMKQKLEPAEKGLFQLKDEYARVVQSEVFKTCHGPVRFMLAGEISSIYKKNDQVRKIHNVIFAPTFTAVEKIQAALEKIGNIRSDGRPILGLDSRDLLEIIIDIDPQNYLIPAHIWTPWFSLLGSKSGFNSVEQCFEDLTPHIFALETGLSSDPPMNWRVSALERYTLVSNSDAHSPQKLAREANLFDTELAYPAIFEALKTGDPTSFVGTVEFFPEEGKYHYDGHRKCGLRWHPQTTLAHKGICPHCGKAVTVGVMHRVEILADRPEGEKPARYQSFQSLIPLPEILAEVYRTGAHSKRVEQGYEELLAQLGSELSILQDSPLEEIERVGGALLAEGIRRMRCGEVTIDAGYDGEYGVIKLFEAQERVTFSPQMSLFGSGEKKDKPKQSQPQPSQLLDKSEAETSGNASESESPIRLSLQLEEPGPLSATVPVLSAVEGSASHIQASPQGQQVELFSQPPFNPGATHLTQDSQDKSASPLKFGAILAGLNPQQQEAVLCTDMPLIIVAGPGTGKTRTLTYRIAYLIAEKGVSPGHILAITFTNKATEEMVNRLTALLGPTVASQIVIKTFHALGAMILRETGERIGLSPVFSICSDQDRQTLLKQLYPDFGDKEINQYLEQISAAKNQLLTPEEDLTGLITPQFSDIYRNYEAALRKNQLLDFDDLILRAVNLFEASPDVLKMVQQRFQWISVDEYQDINFAQYRLLRLLTSPETNICAIGDPDQAIYGFRGAKREYFLKFQEDFPEAKILHLNQNYRSTQLILAASGQVIAKSAAREPSKIWSDFIDKTKLEIYQTPTDKAEAEYVVHQIEKMVGGTSYFSLDSGRVADDEDAARSFADFAVLYRVGAQSQPLVEALQRSGIPYQTVGQTPFYERKEIKEILACLWFIYNPASTFQLEQPLPPKKLTQIVPFLNDLRDSLNTQSVSRLIELIQQFRAEHRFRNFDEKQTERVQQLILRATPFENRLQDFLESTMLQKETDAYDPRADRVTLMTLHASKGLEFPVVFMVGCEENLLPYQMPGKAFDLEEERRLFYVGMTRAQQKLILTHAKTRFLFGHKYEHEPSRFLSDIEHTLKEIKKMASRKPVKEKQDSAQLKLF